MNRSCWSPMPTPTTSRWSTSRNQVAVRRWVSFPPAGIPPLCGLPATARRSTWPTARARARGPIAMGRNPVDPAGDGRAIREYIGGLFQGTLSVIPMPDPSRMAVYSRTVYECSPLHGATRRPCGASPCLQATPFPPGLAVPRQSSMSFTSSRRIEPTTKSSAIMTRRQGRPSPLPLPRGRHSQSPRLGTGVRAPRQFLRGRRGQR